MEIALPCGCRYDGTAARLNTWPGAEIIFVYTCEHCARRLAVEAEEEEEVDHA